MEWINLMIGFFISNALGYGGGPASIPIMYQEIVVHYHWVDDQQFSNILALGNALPGPIATKIAAYIGYDVYGVTGMVLALCATIVPSAAALVLLLRVLKKYRTSAAVKGMTLLVQPVIAIMMLVLTWQLAANSITTLGILQPLCIAAAAYWLMVIRKVHPAIVIVAACIYGGMVVPYINI